MTANETKTTATVNFRGTTLENIPVINPGDWFGKTWLIEIVGSYTSLYLVVESNSEANAIDELADDETWGRQIRIEGSDLRDYGCKCDGCDDITHPDGPHWVREDGSVCTDESEGKYLAEPYYGGNAGIPCDLDHLAIHDAGSGVTSVVYRVEGVDRDINPAKYHETIEAIETRAKWEEEVEGPGKFEACAPHVAYFWEKYLHGFADDDNGTTVQFDVTEDDRLIFPELDEVESIFLEEDEQGFVSEVDGMSDPGAEVAEVIACLSREVCVELLESVSIECRDDETVETLREAVQANVDDGTIDISQIMG